MARLRLRSRSTGSSLESRFLWLWQLAKGPPLEREFRFHAERRWRADFAHLPSRTLIEIEGGIWIQGRHNRAAGFNADLEKYLEAGLAGWRVFRLGPEQMDNNGARSGRRRCRTPVRKPRPRELFNRQRPDDRWTRRSFAYDTKGGMARVLRFGAGAREAA